MTMIGSSQRGYTLVEILIVTAIIVTLTTISLPAFDGITEQQQARSVLHKLSAHLAYARTTAISHGISIGVCPSAGDGRCTGEYDWSNGWITFRDPGKRGQPENSDAIVRYENAPVRPPLRLMSSSGRRSIRFLPDGRSAGSNLRIRVCNSEQLLGEVVVNNLGRIRMAHTPILSRC
jgi:type IV fimbrial biogenesis protein FimT